MAEISVTISHNTDTGADNDDKSSSSPGSGSDTNLPSSSLSSSSSGSSSSSALVPFMGNEPRLEILIPDFKLTAWNPMRGVDFLGLMRMPEPMQIEHVCKIRMAPARRRMRREELNRKLTGQNKAKWDEKKLLMAASDNDSKLVEDLLDRGIDPCFMDVRRRTALHVAASKGHDRVVSILVKRGANPNQKDCIGNTPLHLAVCCNHLATVSILLDAGTDLCALDNSGRTPMHLAQSRINVLQRDLNQGHTTQHVKDEVLQVADMMNSYLRVCGDDSGVNQLTDLCHKLQLSNTKEELSSVNHLLEEFTSLSLLTKPSSTTNYR